jgi:hypothetical protein
MMCVSVAVSCSGLPARLLAASPTLAVTATMVLLAVIVFGAERS